MFKFWPDNYDASWHLLRPMAAAMFGGAEANEVLRVAAEVGPDSRESWHAAWLRMGAEVEALAARALEQGHTVTARDHYLRACIYFRWADFFLPRDDERRPPTYDRCAEAFRIASRYLEHRVEEIEVPYEGITLPGFFFRSGASTAEQQPTVLYVAGADVLREELYFMGGKAALDRGMSLLVADGPGQGATLRFRGLPSRFDYEKPVGAAIDYLVSRSDVRTGRIGLLGRSMGGYYGARAVAFEPRVRACALFGALYDAADLYDQYPPLREQFQWLTGAEDLEDTRARMARFNLSGVAEKITCPLLVVHGEDDHLVPAWHARRTYEEAGSADKRLVLYGHDEPGSVHCGYDGFPYVMPTIFDWFYDHLVAS